MESIYKLTKKVWFVALITSLVGIILAVLCYLLHFSFDNDFTFFLIPFILGGLSMYLSEGIREEKLINSLKSITVVSLIFFIIWISVAKVFETYLDGIVMLMVFLYVICPFWGCLCVGTLVCKMILNFIEGFKSVD
jgi:hypothetical protein